MKLKEAGYTVITVGLGLNNETATWLREKVASAGCAFTADTAEELNKIFQNIQSTITQSRSLTGVQVTDIIDAEFELTDAEIDYYIEHYKPFDKAGAYGIQEWIGYIGVTGLDGSYYNVMGFPVQRVYAELTNRFKIVQY